MGRIGQDLAKRLEPFKVRLEYTGPTRKDVPYAYHPNILDLAKVDAAKKKRKSELVELLLHYLSCLKIQKFIRLLKRTSIFAVHSKWTYLSFCT